MRPAAAAPGRSNCTCNCPATGQAAPGRRTRRSAASWPPARHTSQPSRPSGVAPASACTILPALAAPIQRTSRTPATASQRNCMDAAVPVISMRGIGAPGAASTTLRGVTLLAPEAFLATHAATSLNWTPRRSGSRRPVARSATWLHRSMRSGASPRMFDAISSAALSRCARVIPGVASTVNAAPGSTAWNAAAGYTPSTAPTVPAATDNWRAWLAMTTAPTRAASTLAMATHCAGRGARRTGSVNRGSVNPGSAAGTGRDASARCVPRRRLRARRPAVRRARHASNTVLDPRMVARLPVYLLHS
jgi:hypothetical protein